MRTVDYYILVSKGDLETIKERRHVTETRLILNDALCLSNIPNSVRYAIDNKLHHMSLRDEFEGELVFTYQHYRFTFITCDDELFTNEIIAYQQPVVGKTFRCGFLDSNGDVRSGVSTPVVWVEHGIVQTETAMYRYKLDVTTSPFGEPILPNMDSHTLARLLLSHNNLPMYNVVGSDGDGQDIVEPVCGIDFSIIPGAVVLNGNGKKMYWNEVFHE